MDDQLKNQSAIEDISTPSVPVETDDDTPLLSLFTTLIVIVALCAGGYLFYRNFSKTHNVPAALSTLDNAVNRQQAPQ